MIGSSLLKTRIRLLQCYDWKPTALCVSQNGSFQSPCSLWEQEFRSSTDIRQPSTVNRVLVSCSGVIGNSPLLVCHTERRPQSHCSMWEQELNRYPSIVNRQPCLSVSLDFSQQAGWTFILLRHIYWYANAGLMPAQCCKRWATIRLTLCQWLEFADQLWPQPSRHEALTQCCSNAGPPSSTSAQQ